MSLQDSGFEIHRQILTDPEIRLLRDEAARVAESTGSVCVRHLGDHSERFRDLSYDSRLLSRLSSPLKPVRRILFDKTPSSNWPVPWHQDLTLCLEKRVKVPGYGPWSVKDGVDHVQPPIPVLEAMVTARLHLDDTGTENGALWVVPGTHRRGKIPAERFSELAESAVPCECQAGDLLLMSPLLLHSSRRSTTPSHRRVLHFEYAPEDALDAALSWRS